MLTVYTDGASSILKTGAVGGWSWWVHDLLYRMGNATDSTSNRMELTAVINAMRTLKPQADAEGGLIVYTDSLYVVNAFAQNWHAKWRANDWKRVDTRPGAQQNVFEVTEVKNRDLWEILLDIHEGYVADDIPISYRHIRGHNMDPNADPTHVEGNRMADKLAVQAKKLLMI